MTTAAPQARRILAVMQVQEAKRLRELEAENARLERLPAEAELDKAALKELVESRLPFNAGLRQRPRVHQQSDVFRARDRHVRLHFHPTRKADPDGFL